MSGCGVGRFYLYQATQDPKYLRAGAQMVWSLNNHSRVPHGFAAIKNVVTKQLEDHMPSFFLSETLMYAA